MKQFNLADISSYLDKNYPKHKGFFLFGSLVYGTQQPDSDIDVVVIEDDQHGQSSNEGGFDLQFMSEESFRRKLRECDIKCLEGFFTDKKNLKISLSEKDINWSCLRASISEKASNSFVKAKKKFKDKEFYIGKKSLFHSLRILMFGIQMAEKKTISSFSQANGFYIPILRHPQTAEALEELMSQYKQEYNRLHSAFKLACPK